MKRLILIVILLSSLTMPVQAQQITAPIAPDRALELMPAQQGSFAQDLWYVVRTAISKLEPQIVESGKICFSIIAIAVMMSILYTVPGMSRKTVELCGCVAIGCMLLGTAGALTEAAADTVQEMSSYAKLFLPVITAAFAAQGGVTGSAALYTGTAVFDAVLTSLISVVLIPMVYISIALSIAKGALDDKMIIRLQRSVDRVLIWSLKTVLYVFTGYMTITGVVSGSTDQAALKATKITISGMIPVVGGIMSDASEAILVGAGAVKNTVGIYGLIAIIAIAIGPFFRIGIQYLMLKLTAAICSILCDKGVTGLVEDLSSAMGALLAMTGAVCLMLLISIICFMKGVT